MAAFVLISGYFMAGDGRFKIKRAVYYMNNKPEWYYSRVEVITNSLRIQPESQYIIEPRQFNTGIGKNFK